MYIQNREQQRGEEVCSTSSRGPVRSACGSGPCERVGPLTLCGFEGTMKQLSDIKVETPPTVA